MQTNHHERGIAIVLALSKQLRGIYNVAGPQPLPLSVIANEAKRRVLPLPEAVLGLLAIPPVRRSLFRHRPPRPGGHEPIRE